MWRMRLIGGRAVGLVYRMLGTIASGARWRLHALMGWAFAEANLKLLGAEEGGSGHEESVLLRRALNLRADGEGACEHQKTLR